MDMQRKGSRGGSGEANGYSAGGTYGYGSYGGYGYGRGGYAGASFLSGKTLRDYLVALRERVWYVISAFLLIFGSVALYTFTRLPQFQSAATVEVFRRTPTVMQTAQLVDAQISSAEDLNTQVNVLQSESIAKGVAGHLVGALGQRFLAPYLRPGHPFPDITELLLKFRDIIPERASLIVTIRFRHPDRDVAAAVANLFADEYIAYNQRLRVNQSLQAVDELRSRADEQRRKVDGIAAQIQAYREHNNLVSLDERKDIVTETLKDLNKEVTSAAAVLQKAETNWHAVEACRAEGRSCLSLSFIAAIPTVSKLEEEVATQKIAVARLAQRYRSQHPQMIAAQSSLHAAEQQLQQAIDAGVAQVEAEHQNAIENYRKAKAALAAQEADSLKLDRYGLEYSNLERDYQENEKLLSQILDSQISRQQSSSGGLENEIARIVDRAMPALEPTQPRYRLNLILGAVSGVIIGIALALFAAHHDDRIKSAFDVETVLGLSLIGIVPRTKQTARTEESEATSADAFTSILSALQLKDGSKKARCMLITSTVAGEGKTFITTSLASAYAAHGERVVVVDCDLRRPAVNRKYNLENTRGLIDLCSGKAKLEDVLTKDVEPNLDIITTGGRAKNPTQLLNNKAFASLVAELRQRYDRVFIDTPPIGIVSDAFLILPLVDGSIYAIFFNKVKRKAAEFCLQRLLDVNVPSFGAVLNGLPPGIGGYYYSNYYGQSYREYAAAGRRT